MSKKAKASDASLHYFAGGRDYLRVADAEAVFFKALIANKNEFRNNVTIHQALDRAVYFLGDPKGRPLDVLVEFQVNDPRTKAPQRIYLGTKLSPPDAHSEPQVTHFLCLGDDATLLTKIHLDRDFNPGAEEKKPSMHLQMGGRVSASLAKRLGGGACCWNKDVDKPRMPSLPVCSALLWHWAFLEYRGAEQVTPILGTWWWNKIVHEAEHSILWPFFEDGFCLFKAKSKTHLLTAFYNPLLK